MSAQRPSEQINAATAEVRARKPQPVYVVRCTARDCDWSVTSNVAKRLAMFWRWHLVDTHGKGAT